MSDPDERVCTVTLNGPEARNALSSELQRALAAALAAAEIERRRAAIIDRGRGQAG